MACNMPSNCFFSIFFFYHINILSSYIHKSIYLALDLVNVNTLNTRLLLQVDEFHREVLTRNKVYFVF